LPISIPFIKLKHTGKEHVSIATCKAPDHPNKSMDDNKIKQNFYKIDVATGLRFILFISWLKP